MNLATAKEKAKEFKDWIESQTGVIESQYVGSVRRDQPDVGDVDLLVVSSDLPYLKQRLITLCENRELEWDLAARQNEKCFQIFHGSGIVLEIYGISNTDNKGAKLLWLTGSVTHNVKLRLHAFKMGYELTPNGLYNESGSLIPATTEAEIFTALGLSENIPSERVR